MAKKTALKSTFRQHRLGAVVVKGGRVLSTGFNAIRHCKETGKSTQHAEEAAIVRLLKDGRHSELIGSRMYVSRFTPAGNVGISKPCERCMGLIRSVGIRSVDYINAYGATESMKV